MAVIMMLSLGIPELHSLAQISVLTLTDVTATRVCGHPVCVLGSVLSDSLRPRGLQPTRLLCPWDSPGRNTGVGCYFLLQGRVLTQGSSPRPWHVDSLPLSHLTKLTWPLFSG